LKKSKRYTGDVDHERPARQAFGGQIIPPPKLTARTNDPTKLKTSTTTVA
jgi:hypothetical protein